MEKAFDKRAFIAAAASVGVSLITRPALAAVGPVGQVTMAQGSSFVQRRGRKLEASSGTDLLLDDFAETGDAPSRLDIRLGAHTRIRLGADAKLHIDRVVLGVEADLRLDAGPVFVERAKGAEPEFKLRSPYALLAARGTAFFAGPSKGVFGVFVQTGVVTVRAGGSTVVVREGQGTDIRFPGAAPTPVKAWAPARVQAALASVE